MGICNKVAGMLAPFVFGALVLHGIGDVRRHRSKRRRRRRRARPLLNAFAAQDPPAVHGHGRSAGAAGDLDRCARRCRRSGRPRPTANGAIGQPARQHLQLPAPVAGRAVPVRLRRRGGDGRRCDRHLRRTASTCRWTHTKYLHLVHPGRDAARLRRRPAADPALRLAGALPGDLGGARRAVLRSAPSSPTATSRSASSPRSASPTR